LRRARSGSVWSAIPERVALWGERSGSVWSAIPERVAPWGERSGSVWSGIPKRVALCPERGNLDQTDRPCPRQRFLKRVLWWLHVHEATAFARQAMRLY